MSHDSRPSAAEQFSAGAHAAHRFTGKEHGDQGEQVRRELEQRAQKAEQDRRK